MIRREYRLCSDDKCLTIGTFVDIETKERFCANHRDPERTYISLSKQCEKCTTHASFGYEKDRVRRFCFQHKEDDMIDLAHNCCSHIENNERCDKRATYNHPKEKKPIYCSLHFKKGMINIRSKKCTNHKCSEERIYGYPNSQPEKCEQHKQAGMINLDLENQCCRKNCDTPHDLIYNNKKYCFAHCPDKELAAALKNKCRYCDIDPTIKHICHSCKQRQAKKEWSIVQHLSKNIPYDFKHNSSSMLQGCSKKRPDIFYDLPTHCVIVEIDENQHKSYNEICECSRINEIVNGIGGRPVVFIRYNPDKSYNTYKDKKKEIKFTEQKKLDLLTSTVLKEIERDYCSTTKTTKEKRIVKKTKPEDNKMKVSLIQLYYDDDYKHYEPYKEDDITKRVVI
jgi:hypothetical protein